MTNSNSARDLCGSADLGLTAKRRQAGTSLVEILVVIVIFLIGILAVVQIFPRGFQLLLTTRNNSVATALGREAIERLKGSPELIPDEVVPVAYVQGVPVIDPTISPLGLAPLGDAITADGKLTRGGYKVSDDWRLAAGPNVARRIIGEGHRVPAPRQVGPVSSGTASPFENYGGLLVLDHNPVDPVKEDNPTIVAYGNELNRTEGGPREAAADETQDFSAYASGKSVQAILPDGSTPNIAARAVSTPVSTLPFEFFTINSGTTNPSLLLPALTTADRTYRIRLSAYVGTGAGVSRVDYTALSVLVPRTVPSGNATVPQLVEVPIVGILSAYGLPGNGDSLYSVEAESIRVAPQYRRVDAWTQRKAVETNSTSTEPVDPFEMKVMDSRLGVLLFSPAARNGVVSRPGGVSEPLLARVDYDVWDWRVIGEDFRLNRGESTYSLSLQSLKVGGSDGPDGIQNGGIFRGIVNTDGNKYPIDPSPTPRDNVIVIDLTTGYEVQRYRTDGMVVSRMAADEVGGNDATKVLLSVDKSRGSVTFRDANPGNTDTAGYDPIDVRLLVPGGQPLTVDSTNRTFRVLYRARQEWAVQLLKGASQYSLVSSLPDGPNFLPDQAFIGNGSTSNTSATKIYFPASQAGSKVTIDKIAYLDGNGQEHSLEGQDFVLRIGGKDTTSLAYADLTEVDPAAASFSTRYGGAPVQGIKGASVSVRVLWNPDTLNLTANSATNFARIDQYNRGWRRSTTQTYLRAEETR